MKKFLEVISDIKMWLAALAVVVAISAGVMGFAQMPAKVEKIDKKVDEVKVESDKKVEDAKAEADKKIAETNVVVAETKDNVQKLAGSVDKYVAIQMEQQKAQEKREELMLKLIEKKKDK